MDAEGRCWLEEALNSTPLAPHPRRPRTSPPGAAGALPRDATETIALARGNSAAGSLARGRRDYAAARAYHEAALSLWRELDDRRGVAAALGALGGLASDQGDDEGARPLYVESLALRRELGRRGPDADAARPGQPGLPAARDVRRRRQRLSRGPLLVTRRWATPAASPCCISLLARCCAPAVSSTAPPSTPRPGWPGSGPWATTGERRWPWAWWGAWRWTGETHPTAEAGMEEVHRHPARPGRPLEPGRGLAQSGPHRPAPGCVRPGAAPLNREGLELAFIGGLKRHVAAELEAVAGLVLRDWAAASDADAAGDPQAPDGHQAAAGLAPAASLIGARRPCAK